MTTLTGILAMRALTLSGVGEAQGAHCQLADFNTLESRPADTDFAYRERANRDRSNGKCTERQRPNGCKSNRGKAGLRGWKAGLRGLDITMHGRYLPGVSSR